MKKLVWRLATRPTTDEVIKLLDAKILTKDEAREILVEEKDDKKLSSDTEKDLKDELALLRKLVFKLADMNIVGVYPYILKEIQVLPSSPWVQPWVTYCCSANVVDNNQHTATDYNNTVIG